MRPHRWSYAYFRPVGISPPHLDSPKDRETLRSSQKPSSQMDFIRLEEQLDRPLISLYTVKLSKQPIIISLVKV